MRAIVKKKLNIHCSKLNLQCIFLAPWYFGGRIIRLDYRLDVGGGGVHQRKEWVKNNFSRFWFMRVGGPCVPLTNLEKIREDPGLEVKSRNHKLC